jgi:arsenate reductase
VKRKKRVLFVCVGNAFRSQMAEAFARAYGADAVEPESAGIAPVLAVPEATRAVMREKGIELDSHFPKALVHMDLKTFDMVVNMSGLPLHAPPGVEMVTWNVPDPVGESDKVLRMVRDEIEQLVTGLLIRLRQRQN